MPLQRKIRKRRSNVPCGLMIWLLAGCASVLPDEPPAVASAPPDFSVAHPTPVDSLAPVLEQAGWSAHTRDGREALLARNFGRAEASFVAALAASDCFRPLDVRVDASFGNLVRLASIYERIGRIEDAKRLTDLVEATAGRRRFARARIIAYQTRFESSAERSLNTRYEPKTPPKQHETAPYDHLIRNTATSFDVDPALVKAIVATESNFEPNAVSRVGAQGLMQLMPETARAMGVRRPFTPSENIRGGVRYLRSLMDRFDDLDEALAAYNAGPKAVVRYGGIPPYAETEAYVMKVLNHYRRYQTRFTD